MPFFQLDKQNLSAIESEVEYVRNEMKNLEENLRAARDQAKEARDQARTLTGFDFANGQVEDSITEKFNSLPNSMEELENSISIMRLRCEGIANIDDSVLVEYQKYQQEIAEKTNECRELESELAKKQSEIETTKPLWLDALNSLISQINNNFSKFMEHLQYSGEVYLFDGNKEVSCF